MLRSTPAAPARRRARSPGQDRQDEPPERVAEQTRPAGLDRRDRRDERHGQAGLPKPVPRVCRAGGPAGLRSRRNTHLPLPPRSDGDACRRDIPSPPCRERQERGARPLRALYVLAAEAGARRLVGGLPLELRAEAGAQRVDAAVELAALAGDALLLLLGNLVREGVEAPVQPAAVVGHLALAQLQRLQLREEARLG